MKVKIFCSFEASPDFTVLGLLLDKFQCSLQKALVLTNWLFKSGTCPLKISYHFSEDRPCRTAPEVPPLWFCPRHRAGAQQMALSDKVPWSRSSRAHLAPSPQYLYPTGAQHFQMTIDFQKITPSYTRQQRKTHLSKEWATCWPACLVSW